MRNSQTRELGLKKLGDFPIQGSRDNKIVSSQSSALDSKETFSCAHKNAMCQNFVGGKATRLEGRKARRQEGKKARQL